ncbi:MAG: hypothetical protein LBK00_09115 [Treponema sp.]|nr:hypothetical protein [Treponema sp.]
MNKILYIATNDLFVRFGGGLAVLAYYEAVKYVYGSENIDLILPQESIGNTVTKGNYFGVPRRKKIIAILSSIFGNLHRFRKYIFLHLKKYPGRYKLCIINGGTYAGDMVDGIKSFDIKVVVIHHNYEREYAVDNKTLSSFRGFFPYYVIRNEKNAYYQADLNLFLTKSDMALFERQYGKCNGERAVIGTFEPFQRALPLIEKVSGPYTMVITGSLGSRQTECGIKDFYKHYYVLLCKELPNVKILFAGRNPNKTIMGIAQKETGTITIIRNPENMEDVIKYGIIYYCPTNVGGGLKLRIMDGLRQGLPVLAHKVSARGYDYFFNKSYFQIYDDEETFTKGIKCLMDLYKNNMIDNKQIQNDYMDYFSFDAGCQRMSTIIR